MVMTNSNLEQIRIDNHNIIENDNTNSRATKELRHFFEVINNSGNYSVYDNNIQSLIRRLYPLSKTDDEQLCFDILCDTDTTMYQLLLELEIWDKPNLNNKRTRTQMLQELSHDEMVNLGKNKWTPIEMLGQLWELYRGFITS